MKMLRSGWGWVYALSVTLLVVVVGVVARPCLCHKNQATCDECVGFLPDVAVPAVQIDLPIGSACFPSGVSGSATLTFQALYPIGRDGSVQFTNFVHEEDGYWHGTTAQTTHTAYAQAIYSTGYVVNEQTNYLVPILTYRCVTNDPITLACISNVWDVQASSSAITGGAFNWIWYHYSGFVQCVSTGYVATLQANWYTPCTNGVLNAGAESCAAWVFCGLGFDDQEGWAQFLGGSCTLTIAGCQ